MLFVSMNRREKCLGWITLAAGILLSALFRLLDVRPALSIPVLSVLLFGAVLLVFHRFLKEALQVPFTDWRRIVRSALLGLIAAQLVTLLINDLFYFFFPRFYFYDDTGPHFVNAQRELLSAAMADAPVLTCICAVFLLPAVTEILHRGLIFTSIPIQSRAIACLVSTMLFAALRTFFLPGQYETAYVIISFVQYIPMGIFFTWIYTATETIFTPILAHMVLNAVSIFTMR